MADAVLEDFRGRDCAFVANWLPGKSETSFVPYLKVFRLLIFLILDSGFEYMNVLSCVYTEIRYLYFDLLYACDSIHQ